MISLAHALFLMKRKMSTSAIFRNAIAWHVPPKNRGQDSFQKDKNINHYLKLFKVKMLPVPC